MKPANQIYYGYWLISLLLTAGVPLATSYYHDVVGNYDGAILTVAIANLISAAMILVIPHPTN